MKRNEGKFIFEGYLGIVVMSHTALLHVNKAEEITVTASFRVFFFHQRFLVHGRRLKSHLRVTD